MKSSGSDGEEYEREIHLFESEEWWVAKDVEAGVASQGKTRSEALENLDEAVALHEGKIGRPPTDEELRELGIDPEDNRPARKGDDELPEFMK